ncbi:glycosyltransferase [methanotrophic endosymbiont of Bathymodiolus puteoserpentis (Logatchev)]|jgi:exo-beta-1,3-glucanase (GH17 family)/cellulose synthase/poly-beta-1,6-N-acetylglucosamine synthase-like glycosyltransferase|uniref:glycosyltransferase n=1 Tax=methanotrophic endosymbiont of Bathymodiolus puteoserpentis (Logatchev) TaxID=343235 RepID=UPI0013C6381E|nr:glycosyltransferase [methanotrophic endosymbiont of Bathymodiolus puteoserpentis (Logatchev)]SHE22727.1 probable glucosyl transferase [methanotrophic endosymbiont of Bathymodiolus puteoserpentis (Logatchev)]
MKKTSFSVVMLGLLVIANLFFWAYMNRPDKVQSWVGPMMGVSFNPMRAEDDPEKGLFPSVAEINQDLSLLAGKVHAVRTYSVLNGLEQVPELAAQHKLNTTIGAWISSDPVASQKEVDTLISISRGKHDNIVRTLVGNESIMRKEVSVEELIVYLRQVRKQTWRPVSTSETWDIWIAHPELADEVDFIATHILPYWEGIPIEDALDYVFDRYHALQEAFPNKPIVLTEVGWPSDGQPIRGAKASRANQVKFLRDFLNRAKDEGLIYYVVEAFDQPWKQSMEGSSGAYWGIFNADRQAKFEMHGDVFEMPDWQDWASVAAILSTILMTLFLFSRVRLQLSGKVFFGIMANLSASTIAWTVSIGASQYQTDVSLLLWGVLVVMQALAILVLLVEALEISEVLWNRKGQRSFKALSAPSDFNYPKVSLHVPIHNEPPEMVKQTLFALAKLDYPNLEVLVIDNNTKDNSVWQPVEAECQRLGDKFQFFHLENWPGFKAGAINYALEQASKDAEIIAVIDSDYIVDPDWLKSLVPYFAKKDVGFVQAPQDYRDWQENGFKTFCHWEYAGFFQIGMVQRNESNAIIQHGTMTLVRKSALESVGNWGEWCICEDSELGLRLYRAGYDSVYVKDSFGRGVTPDTLSGYMTQRHRWVYGAMQILKRHWQALLLGNKSELTSAQRYYFVAGWLPWFSDALALLFTFASLFLTAQIVYDPIHSELPVNAFILPTIGLFGFKVFRTLWLYHERVSCSALQTLGAAIAGLALTHTVAKAIWQGLFTSGRPFMRTPKFEKQRPFLAGLVTIKEELVLLILLWSAAAFMISLEQFDNLSGQLWAAVLLVQSMPYFASLLLLLVNVAPNIKLSFLLPNQVPQTYREDIFDRL